MSNKENDKITDIEIGLSDRNKSIPTETIQKDINDTQREIEQLKREHEGYKLIGDKMSIFKADNRLIQIKERQRFIDKLETILKVRKAR